MKRSVFIIAVVLFINFSAKAQHSYKAFTDDLYKHLRYPRQLRDSCITTYTNLLIVIDARGKVFNMLLSDSAPALLVGQFNQIKNNLDTKLLDAFIKEKNLRSTGILIPLFFIYADNYCSGKLNEKEVAEKYMMFNGESYSNRVIVLPPLISVAYKPVQ